MGSSKYSLVSHSSGRPEIACSSSSAIWSTLAALSDSSNLSCSFSGRGSTWSTSLMA